MTPREIGSGFIRTCVTSDAANPQSQPDSQQLGRQNEGIDFVEFDWSGCLLTDKSPAEDMQAFVGSEAQYLGQPGVIEAIRLVKGSPPWDEESWRKGEPRPVYSVRWRPAALTGERP